MPSSVATPEPALRPDSVDAVVTDYLGQESVDLHDLDPAMPVGDVLGLSTRSMALPPKVTWNIRDNHTSRLLRRDQPIGEVARERRADLTLQPAAILG